MIRGVLFDNIDTLVAIQPQLLWMYEETVRECYLELAYTVHRDPTVFQHELEQVEIAQVRRFYKDQKGKEINAFEIYKTAFDSLGLDVQDEQITHIINKEQEGYCKTLVPASNVHMVLDFLVSQGYKLGIVSNAMYPAQQIIRFLDQLGILQYFSAYAFSHDVGWRKPSPKIFEYVLKKLEISPVNAVMIGDRLDNDISPAQQLGCWTIQTIQFQQQQLQGINPDLVIRDLNELIEIFSDNAERLIKLSPNLENNT